MSLVEVLLCGSIDRGDDGAPIASTALIQASLPSDVPMRVVGQLQVDDLVGLPIGTGVVIVDAATGLAPGRVVDLPLSGLTDRADDLRPRSSHALSLAEVIGLAQLLRGRSIQGRIIAIGASDFGLGHGLSRRVAASLPALAAEVVRAVQLTLAACRVEIGD